jgi:hypothetical protein
MTPVKRAGSDRPPRAIGPAALMAAVTTAHSPTTDHATAAVMRAAS